MNKQERQVASAAECLKSATAIVGRLESSGVAKADIQAARTAANQARQAAQELDVLCGMLEVQ